MKELDFKSKDILAYIILKCMDNKYEIGYTKGQKLLYCCYGAILADKNIIICSECPQAWTYGPVFPDAFWQHHKGNLDYSNKFIDFLNSEKGKALKEDFDLVISFFGKMTASELVAWTHQSDSPWSIVSNGGQFLYRK